MSTKIEPRRDTPGLDTAFQLGQQSFLQNLPLATALERVPAHAKRSFERGWRQEFEDWFNRPVDFMPGV